MNIRRRLFGFTIIELMAALAVFAMMVVLLAGTVDQMLKLNRASQSETDRLEKAGTAFDLIRRDLKGALLPVHPKDTQSLQFRVNANSLFWQAPSGTETDVGDINIYGYFVAWDDETKRARLCRVEIEPDDGTYRIDTDPQNWMPDLQEYSGAEANNYKGLIAEDVIGFWIRCLDENGAPMANYTDSRTPPHRLPAAIELALVVLDSASAARLNSEPSQAGTDIDDIQSFIDGLDTGVRQGARLFRTTIPLANARYQTIQPSP